MCSFKRNKIIDLDFIEKEFQEKAKRIHDNYNKNLIISKPLYHYTNFDGLKGILENREFWFTDYNDLNDPTEYKLSLQIVGKAIGNFIMRSRNKEFWDRFRQIYPYHEQHYKLYTFSFCESQDYLPAWREYAENGKGFAIGFHQDYFQPSQILPADTANQVSIKVLYDDIEFAKHLENFLKLTDKIYKKYFNPQNILIKDFNKLFMEQLSAQLISLMPGFKHFGYQYEHEHRLYEGELLVNGEAYPIKISEARKFTENDKNRLRSPKFNHGDICEIWVGPCHKDFESSKKKVEGILKISGYDLKQIEIKKSEMPYRIK